MSGTKYVLLLAGLMVGVVSASEEYHLTSDTVGYKCIFNHELLIVSHSKSNSPAHIKSFIAKLADTDVDAVMCCPTMWRMNVFPSKVDLSWKRYQPGQPLTKFRSWDYMMQYLHKGGDPVKETLEACRTAGKDFFVSYRMNDRHYTQDLEWPCHHDIWRQHPEYWLGDSAGSPVNARLFNYMLPQVRDYYFSIIEELCTSYDVDGVELDFQRFPAFFRANDVPEGTKVMTAFVGRIKAMMDKLGKVRGKSLKLCVRVPETLAKCKEAGLDVPCWDAQGLIEMINISSFYLHTMELGIEEFRAATKRARIYGEMNYVTTQNSAASKFARRYTTIETYRAAALNFLSRGVDGLSLFNYDYVPDKQRLAMAPGLKKITDVEFLKQQSKNYVVYPGFGTFPANTAKTVELVIPDDTAKVKFERAILRIETKKSCAKLEISAVLNGQPLQPCAHEGTELFPALAQNAGYPKADTLKFYTVPLSLLVPGKNKIELKKVGLGKESCQFFSLELGMYRGK